MLKANQKLSAVSNQQGIKRILSRDCKLIFMGQLNIYLTLTFRKILVVIYEYSPQRYLRLKTFLIASSSCSWFSINKYLFKLHV